MLPVQHNRRGEDLCSLAIGFALWYVAVQEQVVLQIFGISAGMATGTVVFNLVAEFYIINAHFLILALAVVRRIFLSPPSFCSPRPRAQKYMDIHTCTKNYHTRVIRTTRVI